MTAPGLLVEPGRIARVALARPAARNAMDAALLRELARAFRELSARADLRAVLLTGEGPDFCAGADAAWMREGGRLPPAEGRRDAALLAEALSAVSDCPVPVVAAARGAVFGGGLGLLAAADAAFVAEGARLCFSEVKLGIMPAVISAWVLPKIGLSAARRWYLTAEVFGAREAVEMGLAHEAPAPEALEARARAAAESAARNAPGAVRRAKALLPRLAAAPRTEALELALDALVELRSAPEGQEGLSAFLEKRPPSWAAR